MIAYATGSADATQASIGGLFTPLIMMGLLLYFFVIRPQKKRQKQVTDMRSALKVGDKVVLISGLTGIITKVKDDLVVIETYPDNSKLTFKNWSIREVLYEDEVIEDDENIEEEEVENKITKEISADDNSKDSSVDLEKK